jgi:hypothetical protein
MVRIEQRYWPSSSRVPDSPNSASNGGYIIDGAYVYDTHACFQGPGPHADRKTVCVCFTARGVTISAEVSSQYGGLSRCVGQRQLIRESLTLS